MDDSCWELTKEALTHEIGDVEEGCKHRTFLGIAEFTDQGGPRHDAGRDSKAEDHAGDNVHGDCNYVSVALVKFERKWLDVPC